MPLSWSRHSPGQAADHKSWLHANSQIRTSAGLLAPANSEQPDGICLAPYLTLQSEQALQRKHELREVYNGLRWLVRTGARWRMRPHEFPRWEAVYQQTQRWLRVGCFEAMAHDRRLLLRLAAGRKGQPSAVIDEIGYTCLTPAQARALFQLVNARYEKGAILLTSNTGFAAWGSLLGNEVLASALLDRLLHHAEVMTIKVRRERVHQSQA